MFGTFRLFLAIAVIVTHIGHVEIVAGQAVYGFFMLSGFLMTAVLQSKYHFSPRGLSAFAISRFVRLFPTYWVSVGLAAISIFTFSSSVEPSSVNQAFNFPVTFREWFSNLFLLSHTDFGIGRIVNSLSPSAWAVDVEILMYVCSCIFLARSERVARTTVIVLLAIYPITWLTSKAVIAMGLGLTLANELLYSFLPSALLPYAIGSWLWFRREHIKPWLSGLPALFIAFSGLMVCAFVISRFAVTLGYILSIPCLAVILMVFASKQRTGAFVSLDELFGRMSYPVYLLQWVCAYLVVVFAPAGHDLFSTTQALVQFTFTGFLIVLGLTLAMSLLVAVAIEGPIERLRPRLVARLMSLTAGRQT
jgi:peptidoglycan/LPS O-acetylase OafA/YrhL